MMSPLRNYSGLVGWLLVAFVAASIGAMASVQARTFYAELSLPAWAPPGWIFGPVWTTLYALMGVSAWLVWQRADQARVKPALFLFIAQLAANALWSWLFFAWKRGALAFAEVLLLWCLILATVVAFGKVRRLAAWLMVPYLAWVTFASILTLAVWQRNPALLG